MNRNLYPAIRKGTKVYKGDIDDSHITLADRKGIETPESSRGFTPDGRMFLDRWQAVKWLAKFDQQTYRKLKDKIPFNGLHSETYAAARGIIQRALKEEKLDPPQNLVNLSTKKALVYDMGLFTENAIRLGRDFGECWYYTPWRDAFPEPFQSKIGEGLEGLERVDCFEEYQDKADLIFVPDTLCAGKVEWLKSKEYPVAGAGAAERLELDRWYGRERQKVSGLPVQETHKIKGVTALRKFTADHKNFWVKIDAFRGLEESFNYTDEKDCEQTIDKITLRLGPYKEEIVFICEEKLKGVEPGIDFITFDGELVYPTMIGYESKGVGIIERVYSENELPESALQVFNGFAPEFKDDKTRFFGSFEYILGKDRLPYVIDPSMRLAAPGVAAIQTELFENYSEVVYGLAMGKKIVPDIRWKYAAAAAMESSAANEEWVNISFPKELRQWVKLRMAIKKKNDYYAIPGFDSIGTVLGFGNTIKAALELVGERAEQVNGKRLSKGVRELDDLQLSIDEGKEYGIDF